MASGGNSTVVCGQDVSVITVEEECVIVEENENSNEGFLVLQYITTLETVSVFLYSCEHGDYSHSVRNWDSRGKWHQV